MAFTGRAIYDSGVFTTMLEDVSDVIGMISPYSTPLLDAIGDANYSTHNVLHEWDEDDLAPNTLIASDTVSTTLTAVSVNVNGSAAGLWIMPGSVLRNKTTGEYLQVTATSASTITFTRAFGGTTAVTIASGQQLAVIAPAALEGADVTVDISRPRGRKSNYCQIIKSDVIVSGTASAVTHSGVDNEFDYQKSKSIKAALRDLEKAVIMGKLSGNTLGSASAYRTMKGIWDYLSTNASSVGSLTQTALDDVIVAAWGNGAEDLNLIVTDANYKRTVDNWQASRVLASNSDNRFRNVVTIYESSFGAIPVIASRWMPANSAMVLATNRIKVIPLRGRSFGFQEVAKTGDSRKGMIVGEYTVELKCENGMGKIYS